MATVVLVRPSGERVVLGAAADPGAIQQTDWPTVATTGAALVLVVGLFWWGLQNAGKK